MSTVSKKLALLWAYGGMQFRIIGQIHRVACIAVGCAIRNRRRIRKLYGGNRWRKLKGIAIVELADGSRRPAEIHWMECHGIGRREFKIKRLLENRES